MSISVADKRKAFIEILHSLGISLDVDPANDQAWEKTLKISLSEIVEEGKFPTFTKVFQSAAAVICKKKGRRFPAPALGIPLSRISPLKVLYEYFTQYVSN